MDVVIRHVSDDSASMNFEPEFAAVKKRYKKYTHASAAAPRRGPLGKDGRAAAPHAVKKDGRAAAPHAWLLFFVEKFPVAICFLVKFPSCPV